ncbi:MAG: hypothetical protein VKL39_15320 [Leptolyngbyaceae bacterium]|nr:hypothetical protein [Leptolyngbyaceae bacterium]
MSSRTPRFWLGLFAAIGMSVPWAIALSPLVASQPNGSLASEVPENNPANLESESSDTSDPFLGSNGFGLELTNSPSQPSGQTSSQASDQPSSQPSTQTSNQPMIQTENDAQTPSSEESRTVPASAMNAYERYRRVIQQTVNMAYDANAQQLANQYDLNVLNVTWEDTGRYNNSAVGPNISDMTIQVQQQNPRTGQYDLHLMPVIRYPNFTDHSADIPIGQFYVPVGNERGDELRSVSLEELLGNMRRYLTEPDSWTGRDNSFLAERDTHVLVSAQAAFLPIPQEGMAEFNPVLFNYQSYPGDPAVLTILATREGTSVTVIDNQRDAFDAGQTWGQRLFFNKNGERASLTGQRASDFVSEGSEETPDPDEISRAAEEDGLNMVMLIQVPLRQREPMRFEVAEDSAMLAPQAAMESTNLRGRSDVEAAVIGHGEVEGPFTEIDGLPIERDPDFPVRVTVQFYKATSNGVVSEADIQQIRQQIARVYAEADYVGSLVVDGLTGRPTEYEGPHDEPVGWWDEFWRRYDERLGRSREDAINMWRRLVGQQE